MSKKSKRWMAFVAMPAQMGITIYVFYWCGQWLDRRYEVQGDWWMKGLTMLGVVVALYQFIKLAKQIGKDE